MEFTKCVSGRRSIRIYKKNTVDREILEKIVATAIFSPSWKNCQAIRYTVIDNLDLKNQIADQCILGFAPNQNVIKSAPVLVIQTIIASRSGFERDGSYSTVKGDGWEMFDAGISAQTFCLSAYNEGLGTLIMGLFDESRLIELVNIPEGQKVISLIALGYPDETPTMPKRKEC